MTRLSPITPQKRENVLLSIGFMRIRQKGSHVFYRHTNGRYTTILFHGGKKIGPALLQKILKEIKLSRKEYLERV